MHLQDNTLLQGGKYKIVRFISAGGFGCTYEAEHTLLEQRVAIKEFFVKDFCNRDEQTAHVTVGTLSKKGLVEKLRRKFVDEAKALAKLHHPGIVRVSDVFEENGTAYYVMDYIDGQSLSQIVKERGPLPEPIALRYIHEVGEALAYVHSKNCLHLDIKPGNIMLEKDEEGKEHVILIDFGASKQYDEENGENTSTLMGKTPGYASIEQMGNRVGNFQASTDIYSLGATLYKLLSGNTPIEATALSSGEELAPLPASVSKGTAAAVFSAMQLNKSLRPQTVREFFNLLEQEQSSEEEETVLDVKEDNYTPKEKTIDVSSNKVSSPSSSHFWGGLGILAVVVLLCIAIFGSNNSFSTESTSIGKTSQPEQSKDDLTDSSKEDNHGYVDLGLSVLWATCNVGANSPEGYGDYFAWGETTPKAEYTIDNSVTYNKSFLDIAGYSNIDAAHYQWGENWRLPTKSEMEELMRNCTTTWTTYKGVKGRMVTSKRNGNQIFLPAAGIRHGTSLGFAGEYGCYWGATLYEEDDGYTACGLNFNSDNIGWGRGYRYDGHSVRPVREK